MFNICTVSGICLKSLIVLITALTILHVEGTCIGSACVNFTAVGIEVSNGLEGAAEAVKRNGEILVQDIEEKGEQLYQQAKSTGQMLIDDAEGLFYAPRGQCECISYNCGCCEHLEEPTIELNATICVNASYLAQDYGMSLTVTVNSYCIFNETVSVRNPPPICLGVPYVKEWAEACVRFHDVDATKSHLHACVRVEARMKRFVIAKYELGCFDIGPHVNNELDSNHVNNELNNNQYPNVVMV